MKIELDYKIDQEDEPNDKKIIISQKEIEVGFDYPLEKTFWFKFKSEGGFTLKKLLNLISKKYQYIYDHEEEYGVWGHEIGDLVLEGITICGNKVRLAVGS